VGEVSRASSPESLFSVRLFRTAIPSAFRCPMSTTSFFPRVMPTASDKVLTAAEGMRLPSGSKIGEVSVPAPKASPKGAAAHFQPGRGCARQSRGLGAEGRSAGLSALMRRLTLHAEAG
jgi:hypothetical protein